jgi:uncharacterized protein
MHTGILTLHFRMEGCTSLKEKRGMIKPYIERVHRQFNVSAAEVDKQDFHEDAVIALAMVNNDAALIEASFSGILEWTDHFFGDLMIQDHSVEIL